ncbi:MAG: LCP family protein [Candidatus Nanoperiomorbaceae bacterium]
MNKKARSIDGFVLRRRDNSVPTPLAPNRIRATPTAARNISVRASRTNTEKLANDLESSLDGLNLVDNHKLADLSTVESSRLAHPAKPSRHDKKIAKKMLARQKKHYKLKKIAKWSAIGLPIAAALVAGFLLVRALIAGGNVFKGNIFNAFATKTKLKEDANGWTNILIFSSSTYAMSNASSYDGANLTDSIMILSVNQTTKRAVQMSVPRDLWVSHPNCPLLGTKAGKINEVYECGSNNGKNVDAGAHALESAVGKVLGITLQYYIHPDWTALQQIVDAIGGVDVTINSGDPYCVGGNGVWDIATSIKYPAGPRHLNGQQALALARARGDAGGCGLSGGNFARENAQREIVSAIQKKVLNVSTLLNPVAVNSLIGAVGAHLVTSFQSSEIQTLIDLTKGVKPQNVTSLAFNNRPNNLSDLFTTGMIGAASVVLPATYNSTEQTDDYSQIQAYVAQNMTNNPVTKEGATVDVLNGSGVSGAARTVADKLKTAGFVVGNTANAPTNITSNVEVFDLSNVKMPNTSAALAKRYNTQVKSGAVGDIAGYTSKDGASFVVVVGPSLANSVNTSTTDNSATSQ